MGSPMGVGTYWAAWKAAGTWAGSPLPRAFPLTRGIPVDLPVQQNAVYIAGVERKAHYVGSTTRGVHTRLREHVKHRARALWEELWVIPLRDDLSRYRVLLAEERVGAVINPIENLRRPGR